ncbi:MAG: cytochrome c oxidase subunit II [Phycisphaerae bacterium]|nr:cytochrome c oxidase subunit II [Phycisphaerae bacterium]
MSLGTNMMDFLSSATARTLAEGGLMHNWYFLSEGASESARDTDDMFMWLWWFCLIWFVFLMGLMGYWTLKYLRKRGTIAPRSTHHNTPLEIAWTVIPTLFLVYIFFRGFFGYMDKVVSPGEALEINLTGSKWSWAMLYPNGAESTETTRVGAVDVPVFYMPAEVPIRLRMNSTDVMHAFWVPDLRTKQDVLPNRYTTLWFKANSPPADAKTMPASALEAAGGKVKFIEDLAGVPYTDHIVFCAEYCGDQHSEMAAVLRVVPEDAWNRWLAVIAEGTGTLRDIGEATFKTKCATCHTIDGTRSTGPSWKNLYGYDRPLVGGKVIKGDDPDAFYNYIVESIKEPGKEIADTYKNQMSIIPLKEKQIIALIEYMKSLSDAPIAKLPTPGAEKFQQPADGAAAPPMQTPSK